MYINKKLVEGVRSEIDGGFEIDYKLDLPEDLISLVPPTIYQSSIFGNAYYFGYKFKDVNSLDRTKFINYIKGLDKDNKISAEELRVFIERPLVLFDKKFDLYNKIDCIVYPRSNRSELVSSIIKVISNYVKHNIDNTTYELIKTLPESIEFDWGLFNLTYEGEIGDTRYLQIAKYIDNELLPKLHALDYFSIAKEVKPKYRAYIKNYLDFASPEQEESFKQLQNKNILVVDDINNSQSTLNEICRIIRSFNTTCNLYIFTLLGK